MPSVQAVDFDALPCSVQRKYFSSLERLQIQQQSLEEARPPKSSSGPSSCATSLRFRPALPLGSRRRHRNVEAAHQVSQSEVDFYLSLPEKLRKQHFSREEQVLFFGRREQVFLPHDRYNEGYPDTERARQRFDDFHFDFHDDSSTISTRRGRQRTRSSSAQSLSPSQVSLDSPTRLFDRRQHHTTLSTTTPHYYEKDRNSESRLFYLNMTGLESQSVPSTPTCRRSRAMSLNIPLIHHSTSSTTLMPDSPLFAQRPISRHQRAHSSGLTGRRSPQTTPIFDPEATHYSDPEARKKLRTYLASPQKFDEAIEFGFPSSAGSDSTTPHYQLPPVTHHHARKFSRDMHSFLRNGKLSFLEDHPKPDAENQGLDSDGDSTADPDSPATPSSSTGASFRVHSRHLSYNSSPLSSPGLPPPLNREMTLRMTLTRPDLRADDDVLYGWQTALPKAGKDDPLALEDLVLTDDMTGTTGAFYVKPKPKGNLVARLLKRASLKAR
ncbi:hypothetical protein P153DRAFT_364211 [Dothidotthia symphoricarpi CBS 119687]|uniref:Mucin-like protein n=1 Tax=Dothidotthia symphoricarpi CBS 119687 TaxID=1392245 RepID=A0A6A6AR28_9PLEO|nr:uncharacterized protein P153DRAFT_364211 [Dothidotthia symphoricarpi CBS 119687]KAF2132961.1 hypothetical protein P153DRAFT_364211 [Dothidotthia symphoricarpi CBS 119687]